MLIQMYGILYLGPPPVHQLLRNDKTDKSPTVSVSSAPTFSSVLRPEDGHRVLESPHSQTGMYTYLSFLLHLPTKILLFGRLCELLEYAVISYSAICIGRDGGTR